MSSCWIDASSLRADRPHASHAGQVDRQRSARPGESVLPLGEAMDDLLGRDQIEFASQYDLERRPLAFHETNGERGASG